MKLSKWISMSGLAGIVVVFGAAACQGTDPQQTEDDPTGAAVGLQISGPDSADWSYNSVEICGVRGTPDDPVPADAKYGCDNQLNPGGVRPCLCLGFNEDGQVVDPYGAQVNLKHLCASEDIPKAPWTFNYTVYSDGACGNSGGVPITGPDGTNPNNFICYDVQDLATRDNPNASVEELHPGLNRNEIFCIAQSARKNWDFTTCDVNSDVPWTPDTPGPVDFDCGCSPDAAGRCQCAGFVDVELPANCVFKDHWTCDILCD